jgi:ubiquinone biosynthesis protein
MASDRPVGPDTPPDPRTIDLSPEEVERDLDAEGGQTVTIGLFGEKVEGTGDLSKASRRRRIREIISIVRRYDVVRGLTPERFRCLLEDLGPTFVKAGQILSMRSEILPEPFRVELEKLRTDVEPMEFSVVLDVLKDEYGVPASEVFASIDPVPLGSASVAQVHRATLRSGEDVAVKVQRPRVRETMGQDIEILRSLVKRATPFLGAEQFLDLKSVVNELWDSFTEETNFLIEARNLDEFRADNAGIKYVMAPKPYLKWCTTHVLVMDYVDGLTISHPAAIEAEGYDLNEIGVKLVENYAKQVLDDGFFHADPHPGNIMVADRKIVFIDLGMMGRLSTYYRTILKDMLVAVAEKSSPKLKDGLLRLSESPRTEDIDHGALLADLDEILETYGAVNLEDLDLGAFLNDVLALARRYDVEIPGSMTMVARGLVTLEGVLDEFIPGVSMIEIIESHVKSTTDYGKVAKDELEALATESHQALHGALKALGQAGLVTDMLTRGQLKLNLDFSGSEDPIEDLSHIADRLTMGVIIAGLLIGSSIVYFAGSSPGIFGIPLLGFAGYFVAIVMSLMVAHDILKRRRKR